MRSIALAAALALSAAAAPAADPNPEHGAVLYRLNCATCHGMEARGDGPMTDILAIDPPDLTLLGEPGAAYPLADVVRRIDGRDMLLAHGGPMPIYGTILEDRSAVVDDPSGDPIFTSQAVIDIAAWLGTVQQ